MKITNFLLVLILASSVVNTFISFGVLSQSYDLTQRFINYVDLIAQGGR